ncbi:uncharacterized protein LOC8077460 isoform X2 [Sorghum bicolor]|uniref:uncharacterized protein LOC8077460 isoform X2 n=1 Tax=Sorghum bicolor TaxID=4558 RepID=UPI000B42468C|nr:uncharacterized protein LOC8077460 isoform X2 [Sorghum bicolor]|eukprot:XP_021310357.1 uncharacterized protein LOC8077460 isoform X2 [Sorghum bicolor]
MASSVAAMPHESASWRDPSRPTPSRGFFNILVSTSSPDAAAAGGSASSSSSASEPTPRRRRQILDRWAAAAAAVTASAAPEPADQPRRARDAELSELASATRPVTARAAVFREPSPAPSDASSTAANAAFAAAGATSAPSELPPAGPRASSLIQRWREIEAIGPVTPRPGTAAADPGAASASDSDTGSPRGRVGCIVKKLSGASSLPEEELDEVAKSELSFSQSAPPSPARMRDASSQCAYPYPYPTGAINCPRPPHLVVRTVRGRRAMEELVAAMAHRRRREVAALAERHAVSRFAHKGRIQSMLRLRLLRQRGTVEDELWSQLKPVRPHQPKHVGELRYDSRDTNLREANNYSQQNNGKCRPDEHFCNDRVPAEEKSTDVSAEGLVDGSGNLQCDEQMKTKGDTSQKDCKNFCVHSQNYSEASNFARYGEHSTIDENQFVEDISPSTTSTLHELETPSSRGDNLREEDNQSINGSWEERGLWISSLGWPAPIDTMSPDSWHQDTMGDIENHNNQIQFNDRPWIDSPNSWRSLCVVTQSDYRALSRNADICNLLESKKVSKSLESDFSNKMNQLLLTALQKQRQQQMMDDFGGYYDERMYWRQNDEIHDADKEASAPCSLAPVSHLGAHQQESWQHSSFGSQHHDNQNLLEMEVRVRGEMSQIHHEIYELRKLVESCIASQVKMQHSIKEEVCSALREAGLMPSQPDTTAAKRGDCCICHRMQVDSLLYRCGHVCTCFDCADQLKMSGRSCPICQSPIDDVVRAQLNF